MYIPVLQMSLLSLAWHSLAPVGPRALHTGQMQEPTLCECEEVEERGRERRREGKGEREIKGEERKGKKTHHHYKGNGHVIHVYTGFLI